MAKLNLNPLMDGMSGSIGELVLRNRNGRTIVARKPQKSNRPHTPAQLAHFERFRLAASYAKASLADPVLSAVYEAVAKEKEVQPYPLAVGDYFNAPTIDGVYLEGYTGKAGQQIVIHATDDVAVASVAVAIRNGDAIVEQATAVFENGAWRYTTRVNMDVVPGTTAVDAVAMDHPGNKTTRTVVKQA
ncbi:MAG: hypothetical protein QM790_03370 [Nibricoccus sp.]